jgi:hypothetical protein
MDLDEHRNPCPDPRNCAWQKKRLEKIVHKIRDISVSTTSSPRLTTFTPPNHPFIPLFSFRLHQLGKLSMNLKERGVPHEENHHNQHNCFIHDANHPVHLYLDAAPGAPG